MNKLTLTKHHGLGNDFLVVFEPEVDDVAELARTLCDRRRGVGADGLLVGSAADGYTARMVLYNADGSRAEMSGNGVRCFAQALATRASNYDDQRILTDAGERFVTLTQTDQPDTIFAGVDMGHIESISAPLGWEALECHPDRPVAHLSLGNPHSVVGVDELADVDLQKLGELVPQINLEIIEAGEQPHEIRMRVHERGVGITEACGTGACAAAFAATRWGFATPLDHRIVVHMDGGSATVEIDRPSPGRVTLSGPATFVASVEVDVA